MPANRTIRHKAQSAPLPSPHNPFVAVSQYVSQPLLIADLGGDGKDTLRVAAVAMPPLPGRRKPYPADNPRAWGLDAPRAERELYLTSRRQLAWHVDTYLEAATHAVEAMGADVVLFSELAFPAREGVPRKAVGRSLAELAHKHDCVIVGGTAHDRRTKMNTGFVFTPDGGNRPAFYHKFVSAIAMDERVAAPSVRNISYMSAFGFNIAVMTCLDFVDYSLVSAAVRASDKTDLILGSCLSKKMSPLVDIARAAGAAIGGYSLLVNGAWRADAVNVTVPGTCHLSYLGLDDDPAHPVTMSSGARVWTADLLRPDRDKRKERVQSAMEQGRLPRWLFGDAPIEVRRAAV